MLIVKSPCFGRNLSGALYIIKLHLSLFNYKNKFLFLEIFLIKLFVAVLCFQIPLKGNRVLNARNIHAIKAFQ